METKHPKRRLDTARDLLAKGYFAACCVLALSIYLAQRLGADLPGPINNYVNDLLCMPIVLKICQYAVRYIRSDRQLLLPKLLPLALTLYYCLFFEYFLPGYHDRYTADTMDILMYLLGLLFFYLMEYGETGKTSEYDGKAG